MVINELRNESCSSPPNSIESILSRPYNDYECLELAVFNHHRFAFYYWVQWYLKKRIRPDLISFDWHQDLAYPDEGDKNELMNLDINNPFEVSFYSWARLNSLNDNHIMAAVYRNLLGNIYVVCKQKDLHENDDEELEDYQGNKHLVRKFKDSQSLLIVLAKESISEVYLDIDLDYFTIENSSTNDKQRYTYMNQKKIREIFNPSGELMRWIFERLQGFTIAMEPEYTGGIEKSLRFLVLLENLFFKKSIGNWHNDWNKSKIIL